MKTYSTCLITLLLFACKGFAQSDSLQKQINSDVWTPFINAFNNQDTDGFMSVHSKELTRVIQDNNMIFGYQRYYEQNKSSDQRSKQNKTKRNIELRFIQRIAGNDRAFEIGYFKGTVTPENGSPGTFYGKFHVLMRKENGKWKILMDADANEKTDEAIFMSAKPME
jgi:ketosteroid isomerase-like protein